MELDGVCFKLVTVNHCLDVSPLCFGVELSRVCIRVYLAVHHGMLRCDLYCLLCFFYETLCYYFLGVNLVLDRYLLAALVALSQLVKYHLGAVRVYLLQNCCPVSVLDGVR